MVLNLARSHRQHYIWGGPNIWLLYFVHWYASDKVGDFFERSDPTPELSLSVMEVLLFKLREETVF